MTYKQELIDAIPKKHTQIRVAAAQIGPEPLRIKENVEKHFEFIRRAKGEDVDILLFPELSLTGYRLGAETINTAKSLRSKTLKSLAQESGNMATIVGFVEEGAAAQIYNSMAVLQKGRDAFVHRKLNLASYGRLEERKFFAQGRYLESFNLPTPFIGAILICADLWNPSLIHLATLRGATIIFAPIASAQDAVSSEFSNPAGWDLVLEFYSKIYGLPIVMANQVGNLGGLHFWGGSQITNAFGQITHEVEGEKEDLLVADIDYGQVRRARFELPTVRDSNLTLIQRELSRIVEDLGVPLGIRDSELHNYGRKQ